MRDIVRHWNSEKKKDKELENKSWDFKLPYWSFYSYSPVFAVWNVDILEQKFICLI